MAPEGSRSDGLHGLRKALRAGRLRSRYEGSEDALCAAVSPDGGRSLSGHEDKTGRLWELDTGKLVRTLSGHAGPVRCACFMPDSGLAVSGGADGRIIVWDTASGEPVKSLAAHEGPVTAVVPFPHGGRAISGGEDGTLKVWSLRKGELESSIEAHEGRVKGVCLSLDGKRAHSAGVDGLLKQWDIDKGSVFGRTLDFEVILAFGCSPDGRLTMLGRDLDLVFLAAGGGQHVRGHAGPARAVAVTMDGRFGLSGGDDKALKVWDLSSQSSRAEAAWTLEGHQGAVASACFSPDARFALSAGRDGLLLWELDWEYAFPAPADWDEGARPYVEAFLSRPGGQEGPAARLKELMAELSLRGFGWLKPEGVQARLSGIVWGSDAAGAAAGEAQLLRPKTDEAGPPKPASKAVPVAIVAAVVALAMGTGLFVHLRGRQAAAGGKPPPEAAAGGVRPGPGDIAGKGPAPPVVVLPPVTLEPMVTIEPAPEAVVMPEPGPAPAARKRSRRKGSSAGADGPPLDVYPSAEFLSDESEKRARTAGAKRAWVFSSRAAFDEVVDFYVQQVGEVPLGKRTESFYFAITPALELRIEKGQDDRVVISIIPKKSIIGAPGVETGGSCVNCDQPQPSSEPQPRPRKTGSSL